MKKFHIFEIYKKKKYLIIPHQYLEDEWELLWKFKNFFYRNKQKNAKKNSIAVYIKEVKWKKKV